MTPTSSRVLLIQKNWAPRGAETAQILYNISRGWVTHNEVDVVEIIGSGTN